MAYVTVPKDLTKIKSKVMFNLTKRQLLCFGAAVAIGLPLFFLTKDSAGTTTAALCMVLAMLPCKQFNTHVPTRYVREERATAGSDYTAICGSEVSSPQRATLSDQQFLYRPCAAGAIR